MQTFDHFAISAATLEAGAAHVARHLGVGMGPGGAHPRMGTHNRLTGLAPGEFLEVIAVDPDAAPHDRARWFDLDRRAGPPRIGNWVLRCDDLDAAVARHPAAGRIVAVERGAFRWRMAVPDDGILPFDGCFPALMQWDTPPPAFADTGLRMTALTLHHRQAGALRKVVADLLADPRVTIETGPRAIAARIDTPDGPRGIA